MPDQDYFDYYEKRILVIRFLYGKAAYERKTDFSGY